MKTVTSVLFLLVIISEGFGLPDSLFCRDTLYYHQKNYRKIRSAYGYQVDASTEYSRSLTTNDYVNQNVIQPTVSLSFRYKLTGLVFLLVPRDFDVLKEFVPRSANDTIHSYMQLTTVSYYAGALTSFPDLGRLTVTFPVCVGVTQTSSWNQATNNTFRRTQFPSVRLGGFIGYRMFGDQSGACYLKLGCNFTYDNFDRISKSLSNSAVVPSLCFTLRGWFLHTEELK